MKYIGGGKLADFYSKGRDLYKIGNFDEALINFKQAQSNNPNNLDYLYAIGNTYALSYDSEYNFKKSLLYYNKILEIDPTHIKAIIDKAQSLSTLGNYIKALEIIDEEIKNSNDGHLWATKGRLLSLIHKDSGEIKNCFKEALKSSDDNSYVYYSQAKVYEHNLEYNKATKCYDESIKDLVNSICDLDDGVYLTKLLVIHNKGWMYVRSKDYEKALECFNEVLKINKKSIMGLYSKSYVYFEQGQLDPAMEILKDILNLNPKHIISLILKAIIINSQGSPKTAMNIFQRVLDIDEKNGLALMNMSWINFQEKEYEKSFNRAKKALEIEPNDGFALYFGSISARKIGNLDLARKWEQKLSDVKVNKIFLEKNLQDKIVSEPWRLKKAGYDLKFIDREYTLKDRLGRLDLLYEDKKTGNLTVIELKVVPATKKTYEQIKNYMDSINKTIGYGKIVKGIVISLSQDETFKNLIEKDPEVSQIDYYKLGLD